MENIDWSKVEAGTVFFLKSEGRMKFGGYKNGELFEFTELRTDGSEESYVEGEVFNRIGRRTSRRRTNYSVGMELIVNLTAKTFVARRISPNGGSNST